MATRRQYVDGSYADGVPGWHEGDGEWKAGEICRLLKDRDITPMSICDIGCGTGAVLESLADRMKGTRRLVGYDVSASALSQVPDRARRIDLRVGDGSEPAEKFDLLLMLDVFEHVEDYMGFLRAYRKRARYYCFHIPLDMNLNMLMRSRALMRVRSIGGHLHYFTADTAGAALTECGYRLLASRYTARPPAIGMSAREKSLRAVRWGLARCSASFAARSIGGVSLLVLAEVDESVDEMRETDLS